MKTLLLQIFTWWNGQTLGTRFHTWRHGKHVGEDEAGNLYYEGGQDSEGRTRRWVIYNGAAEASAIPAGWHGWMHHRTEVSP
ncbi:MAG: NADH-ubiquinone oxidoreductase subunit NDUFA12 family protein, partial [Hoeflea sp.]|nr:NADH-ubiquinone oxidoreductase subunit NDUFA12 family protein [Hoeflea sp.]